MFILSLSLSSSLLCSLSTFGSGMKDLERGHVRNTKAVGSGKTCHGGPLS